MRKRMIIKVNMKKKPSPRQITVTATQAITPNMQRITLQSPELSELPSNCEGGYIKLLFTSDGGTDISGLADGERPIMRTYTIRHFDQQSGSIEVDFVRHITHDLQCGFAARWALNTKPGDTICFVGPGIIQNMSTEADWFFMVADMTALPALSAKACQLPDNAKGYAVIKVLSEEDRQAISVPKNMRVEWIYEADSLDEKVRSLPWLNGIASVWCACEFDSMRALRQYFRNEKKVERDNIYISSYWKQGVSEDGHKAIKHQDATEQETLA